MIRLVLASQAKHDKFRLTTSPTTPASAVEPYYDAVAFGMQPLGLDGSCILTNFIWSKFTIHGIPINATRPVAACAITQSYRSRTLCQMLRCSPPLTLKP